MILVKKFVVSVAEVPSAVLAELCSPLSTASFAFHAFLAGDAEAADVSYLDLFAELEIGASVGIRGSHLFRS